MGMSVQSWVKDMVTVTENGVMATLVQIMVGWGIVWVSMLYQH